MNHLAKLHNLFPLQVKLQHLHPLLQTLYPVVIAEEDEMLVYEPRGSQYVLAAAFPSPMPIPRGVRAAFPLEEFGGRMACVVTEDVFDSLDGYVTIFHEFVHCYQYETCEPAIKSQLAVAQKALAENDPMWEINAPFPYGNEGFINAYTRLGQALGKRDLPAVIEIRTTLRGLLAPMDYEYMLWQEWKEGFARWVENRMQAALNLPLNLGGGHEPYTRVSFYARGAALIDLLADHEPGLVNDIEALFNTMFALPTRAAD
jgi:hypothetical protein